VLTPTPVSDGGRASFNDILPKGFLTINVKFLPEPGMVLYVFSVVLITVVLQLVYHMHRRANVLDWEADAQSLPETPKDVSDPQPTGLLTSHRFFAARGMAPVPVTACAKIGVVAAWAGAVICLFYGMTNPISEYKILGAAGQGKVHTPV
jgi:hypothetical protein